MRSQQLPGHKQNGTPEHHPLIACCTSSVWLAAGGDCVYAPVPSVPCSNPGSPTAPVSRTWVTLGLPGSRPGNTRGGGQLACARAGGVFEPQERGGGLGNGLL